MEELAIIFTFILAVVWIVFHHITKWAEGKGLSAEDEHMLEDLWRSARRMESRIVSLEAILDAEQPDWRKKNEE